MLAQPRIELDAIDHLDAALKHHVLGPQVAVTVADEPSASPGEELRAPALQEGHRQPLRAVDPPARNGDQCSRRREVSSSMDHSRATVRSGSRGIAAAAWNSASRRPTARTSTSPVVPTASRRSSVASPS